MRILHYFSPMSGFAYLGMGALCSLAAEHGVEVSHRPVDIRKVFAATDTIAPAAQSPARLAWRQTDMARWAQRRGLPLNIRPRHWPIKADLAACAIIAADQLGLNSPHLAQALLGACWARDLDISQPETIGLLAGELGMNGDDILRQADGAAARGAYDGFTAEAIAAGVVGSPTFMLGTHMFFGQDRLDFLEDALTRLSAA